MLDPLAAVLLARRRRSGVAVAVAVLVSDAAANGFANYALDRTVGVTAGRVAHAVITMLAIGVCAAAPRLWHTASPLRHTAERSAAGRWASTALTGFCRGRLTVPNVVTIDDWAEVQHLTSDRLELEPLRPEHADEMAPLLDDVALHTFIGGRPATCDQLRGRYTRQVVGRSPDGSQRWLNWVVRRRINGQAVGTTQATVSEQDAVLTTDVAWVIGASQQRQGYAQEAAKVMVWWLRHQGVEVVVAYVHPQHPASMAVARAIGLAPTDTVVDGEVRWLG